jgi:hypothetical protein
VPRLEVRCPFPCPETAGFRIRVRLSTGAPWYVSNRQIHEDVGVPLFADHIRAQTTSFDSKVADLENPTSTATRQILTLNEG